MVNWTLVESLQHLHLNRVFQNGHPLHLPNEVPNDRVYLVFLDDVPQHVTLVVVNLLHLFSVAYSLTLDRLDHVVGGLSEKGLDILCVLGYEMVVAFLDLIIFLLEAPVLNTGPFVGRKGVDVSFAIVNL